MGAGLGGRAPFKVPEPAPDLERPTIRRRAGATLGDLIVLTLVQLVIAIVVVIPLAVAGAGTADAEAAARVIATSVAAALLVVLPASRTDRASPGAWATWLGVASAGTARPAARRAVLVIFLVRWLPAMLTGLPFVLPLTFAIEALTVAVRRDRRTLSAVIARTDTVTRRSLESPPAG